MIHRSRFVLALTAVFSLPFLLSFQLSARPRPPMPPWPEFAPLLSRFAFDEPYRPGTDSAALVDTEYGQLIESWSGYALIRSGPMLMPFVVPAIEAGRTNLATDSGAVRLWFKPYWSSVSLPKGTGPGAEATLVEMVVLGEKEVLTAWALRFSADGNALVLTAEGDGGTTELLRADVAWPAGEWHCLALNYGTMETALFLDGQLIAKGAGVVGAPASGAGLAIGSSALGTAAVEGEFDEICAFGRPVREFDLAFYRLAYATMAARGPISVEEEAALKEAAARRRAQQQAMLEMPQAQAMGGAPCPSENLPYLRAEGLAGNLLRFHICALPNESFDLYFVNNITAQRWQWRRVYRGVQCDANGEATFALQQPDPVQGFFVILNAADDDADGLSDGYEDWFKYNDVSTVMNDPDTDGDLMSDGWEVEYGLNPTSAVGIDGAAGNPDGDTLGGALTNIREFQFYNLTINSFGSFDPLKVYNTSANRPVVWVTTSTPTPLCETASFTIQRAGGFQADYTQPLFVYYSVGGDLRYGTDYNLNPAPQTEPGDQDHPDGYPRIFLARIPPTLQTVTIVASLIGHPVTSDSKKLQVALTPYSVSRKSQVASAPAWSYVVDLQNKRDRTTITFDIANLRPLASGQAVQACRNTAKVITLSGSDNCGSALTFAIVNPPAHGALSAITPINNTSASVTYTPNPGYCGADSFTFKVNNGAADSEPATVTVQVGDPSPAALCQDVTTAVGQPVTFTVTVTDLCSESKSFMVVSGSGPANGQLAGPTPVDANRASFTYTPNAGFEGVDGVDYTFTGTCFPPAFAAHVTIYVVSAPVLFASCREDRINLHWKVPQSVDQDFFFYDFHIYRCETATASCTPTVLYHTVTPGSARGYVDTAVQPGTTYCYRIKFRHQNACDLSDFYESEFSNSVCTQPCTPSSRALITGHHAGGSIQTVEFADGSTVNSFYPTAFFSGRGLAIHNNEIFYTGVFFGDNSIHVCPYGTEGSGGTDTRTFQNTWRPNAGIQDLAVHANVLYVLTGYPDQAPLKVFALDPASGAVIGNPMGVTIQTIQGRPTPDADGFTVLPNGNFLINDIDGFYPPPVYREYNGMTGQLIQPPQGLEIDLRDYGFPRATGVAIAPNGESLYFLADFKTLVQTDMAGNLLGFQDLLEPGPVDLGIEDIDVVVIP